MSSRGIHVETEPDDVFRQRSGRRFARFARNLMGLLIMATLLTTAEAQEARITHGPMLGRLGHNGIGVWVRTSRPATFHVRYGLAPDRLNETSVAGQTRLESDCTGWIHVRNLKSSSKYYYQAVVPSTGASTTVASFQTLPRPEDTRHPEYNPDGLFNFSFEFAILNGDWLYERKREYPADQWLGQVGASRAETPEIVRLAPSIVGVWENYKDFLGNDPDLSAWHREVPSFFTFDDHEILNDISGTGEIGFRGIKAVFRDIGVRAWRDYLGWSMPETFRQDAYFGAARLKADSDILTDPKADFSKLDLDQAAELHVHWGGQLAGTPSEVRNTEGGDANAVVYEIVEILDAHRLRIRPAARMTKTSPYSIGRLSYTRVRVGNCDFFYLDTRGHRQIHDINNPGKPGVSLIGKRQKRWLKKEMARSKATFFFVVSSVNFMIPHVAPKSPTARPSNKDEAWTAFLEEREDMIGFWDNLGKPVFVLTGDLHNSFAIKITDRVWEFASGPHSSTNHSADHEAGRPANGPYQHGPRPCEIRWSSYVLSDLGREAKLPHYCVVQVNNVFRNPGKGNTEENRWIAFPRPHVIFQYYDGLTGKLRYAEPVFATQ